MEVRLVRFKPKKAAAPVNGIVYHENGKPAQLVRFEYRQNKTSAWSKCAVVMGEE